MSETGSYLPAAGGSSSVCRWASRLGGCSSAQPAGHLTQPFLGQRSKRSELLDPAAESLGKHAGDRLSLNGLASLADAAAESLSKHAFKLSGGLTNLRLTSLSDLAAESLSKREGGLELELDNLPASASKILRQHPSFQDDE
jgi:hypothetical protein